MNGVDREGYSTEVINDAPPPAKKKEPVEEGNISIPDNNSSSYKEDRIVPELSVDENGKLTITIKVTGKVIDYTEQGKSLLWGETAAEAIARRINDFGNNELFVGEEGFFGLSDSSIDVSKFVFDINGEKRQFNTAKVKFKFDFEAAESIIEASPDDHIIALLPTPSKLTKDRNKSLEEGTVVEAATGTSRKIAFMNIYSFTGPKDFLLGYGEAIAAHEIISHFMGLGHAEDAGINRVNKGGGVYNYSNKVTVKEAEEILVNISDPKFGSGSHSSLHRPPGWTKTYIVPNISYDYLNNNNKYRRGSIRDLGFDIKEMINHEIKQQSKK